MMTQTAAMFDMTNAATGAMMLAPAAALARTTVIVTVTTKAIVKANR